MRISDWSSDVCSSDLVKPPGSPMLLAHLMVDTMIDRFLAIREPMAKLLTTLQDDLLDPRTSSTDWRVLLENRKQVRRREVMLETQIAALDAWRCRSGFACQRPVGRDRRRSWRERVEQ